MSEYRQCVDEAIRCVTDAWNDPSQAAGHLAEAERLLDEALRHAEGSKDPARMQQVRDAKNAVEQARRAAENQNQDDSQTHNAIDQAARACKQIH
ncbi:hypothetical protein [Tuberibacillus calidus]|uniref:hypothetical protein n=1 Tax=Tuberibacillus calidus TaxID=340097 RepID=UPI0003F6752C|nr:hypothetical protein [Tuberibacillus calidus]